MTCKNLAVKINNDLYDHEEVQFEVYPLDEKMTKEEIEEIKRDLIEKIRPSCNIKENEKQYQCNHCDEEFVNKNVLRKHLESNHSEFLVFPQVLLDVQDLFDEADEIKAFRNEQSDDEEE